MLKRTLITAEGVCQEIISLIGNATELGISGEVRSMTRRFQSKLEDVIVSPLVFDAQQVQRGVFLINIHVPNLLNQQGGGAGVDNTQPNKTRFEEIADKIRAKVDETENISLSTPGELIPDNENWFYSIQVEVIYLRNEITETN